MYDQGAGKVDPKECLREIAGEKIKEHQEYTSIKFSSCSEALSHTDARQSSWGTSLDLQYYCQVFFI